MTYSCVLWSFKRLQPRNIKYGQNWGIMYKSKMNSRYLVHCLHIKPQSFLIKAKNSTQWELALIGGEKQRQLSVCFCDVDRSGLKAVYFDHSNMVMGTHRVYYENRNLFLCHRLTGEVHPDASKLSVLFKFAPQHPTIYIYMFYAWCTPSLGPLPSWER